MSTLKTNYTDDVFSGNRKYNMITNDDGTVSFVDVTVYSTEGDSFGASDINAINTEVNNSFKKTEDISAIGLGSAAKKNVVTSVTSGGGDVPTAGAVYSFTQSQINDMIADYLTAESIKNTYAPLTSPQFIGSPKAPASSNWTAQIRNISAGTADIGVGASLSYGQIYFVVEER